MSDLQLCHFTAGLNFRFLGDYDMSIYLIDNIIVPLDSEPDFRRDALKSLH